MIIFVLILTFTSSISGYANGGGAVPVRVGGFDSYAQCVQQGEKFKQTKGYADYVCIPVNHL